MVSPAQTPSDLQDLQQRVQCFQQETLRDLWRLEHDESRPRHDLETAIVLGLAAFYRIRDLDARWSAVVNSGLVPFDAAAARQIERLYTAWREPAQALLTVLARLENQHQHVQNAAAFRAALTDCPRLDVDKTLQALESQRAGQGVPHREAMNELRRRLLARSH